MFIEVILLYIMWLLLVADIWKVIVNPIETMSLNVLNSLKNKTTDIYVYNNTDNDKPIPVQSSKK
jgi:hypothetical protein